MPKRLSMTLLITLISAFSSVYGHHTTGLHPDHPTIITHSIASQTDDGLSSFVIDFPVLGNKRIDQYILARTRHHRHNFRTGYQQRDATSGSYHQSYTITTDNSEYILILLHIQSHYGTEDIIHSYQTILFDKQARLALDMDTLLQTPHTREDLAQTLRQVADADTDIDSYAFTIDKQSIHFYPTHSSSEQDPITLPFEKYRWLFDISAIYEILSPRITHSRVNHPIDCSLAKCVALTFDDGPGPHTQELLGYLAQYDVPATFFLLGSSVQRYPSLTSDIALAGHEIGNHSWDHPDLTRLHTQDIRKQIEWTDDQIYRHTGQHTRLIRPPYGAYDDTLRSLTDKAIILRSIDPQDWKMRKTDTVAWRMSQARPGDIILSHDIRPTTVAAIPTVIETLASQGYHFVTVSQLLGTLESGEVYRQQ